MLHLLIKVNERGGPTERYIVLQDITGSYKVLQNGRAKPTRGVGVPKKKEGFYALSSLGCRC